MTPDSPFFFFIFKLISLLLCITMAAKLHFFSFLLHLLILLIAPLLASGFVVSGFIVELIHKESLLHPTTNLSISHLNRLLAKAPHSLLSQLSPETGKRSLYCLSPFQDNASTSFMSFGDKAAVLGGNVVSTLLVEKADKTFYFVMLEAISVGGKKVDATGTGEGNMFINSGTTVSLIDSEVFEKLGDLITDVMELP